MCALYVDCMCVGEFSIATTSASPLEVSGTSSTGTGGVSPAVSMQPDAQEKCRILCKSC